LIAAAKATPDSITVASPGVGSAPHVSWELFRSMTGIRMLHVPYRGGAPAITDLLSQQVQVYFANIAEATEHIKAGRLRALAVAAAVRIPALPDVPTIAEFVPGYESLGWVGVVAPKNTLAPIIDRSTRRSMPVSPIPKSNRPLPIGVKTFLQLHPQSSESFSLLRTRNGARSSERRISNFSASKSQLDARFER